MPNSGTCILKYLKHLYFCCLPLELDSSLVIFNSEMFYFFKFAESKLLKNSA